MHQRATATRHNHNHHHPTSTNIHTKRSVQCKALSIPGNHIYSLKMRRRAKATRHLSVEYQHFNFSAFINLYN
jgi:hypothetical protein